MSEPTDTDARKNEWTRERIEAFLEAEDLRYQNVELPFGLATGDEDRSRTADLIFPADLTGKSVLDIGCKFGFFCFEALKRGAERVLGVDVDPQSIRKARTIAEILGVRADFRLLDIERDPLDDTFDYVLCLNLLHHLKDPIHSLDRMSAIARDRLVLEVAGVGEREKRKLGLSWIQQKVLKKLPIIVVGNNQMKMQGNQNCFFTTQALSNLLTNRTLSFGRLSEVPSPHKDRQILTAEKRRIRRLILVAGPTSSGKSTLIDSLQAGKARPVLDDAGVERPEELVMIGAAKYHELLEPRLDTLILHYDLMHPMHTSDKTYERDPALGLMDVADEVVAYTIWTPLDRLRRQFQESELSRKKIRKRTKRVKELYESDERIHGVYERWLTYLGARDVRHQMVTYEDGEITFVDDPPGITAGTSSTDQD